MTAVAEGVETTRLIHQMAQEQKVEMPVTEQVYQVLFEDKPVLEALGDLMSRSAKAEWMMFFENATTAAEPRASPASAMNTTVSRGGISVRLALVAMDKRKARGG